MKRTILLTLILSVAYLFDVPCLAAVQDPVTCAKVDTTGIYVYMDVFNSRFTRTIAVDNSAGKQMVTYRMSLRYIRSMSDWEGLSAQDGADAGSTEPSTAEADSAVRVMQYEREALLSYAYGLADNTLPQTFATKYKADAAGFNVSSVGTWFTGDCLSQGVIKVEVRAGGTSIDDAIPLATGALLFSVPEGSENGRMYSIPLSRPATIYPDEEFYVLVTYPPGQARPQGSALNQRVASVAGRYLMKVGAQWEDLQQQEGFTHGGWLMNVGETTPENIAWLEVYSTPTGTIRAGATTNLMVRFMGLTKLKGMRRAELTVTISDSCNTTAIVPITLHINEAPFFLNAPKKVYLPENTVRKFDIELYDNEDHSFVLEPLEGAKIVTHTLSGSKLTLTVAPRTGDAGTYHVKFRLTDSLGESRTLDIPIYVTVLEQLIDPMGLVFPFMGATQTFHIDDLFRYVNGNDFSFVATTGDAKIIQLERTGVKTIDITPGEPGSTYIHFSCLDDEGNTFPYLLPVTVGQCEDPSRAIVQKWNNVLLVNNYAGNYVNEGYQWYKNRQEIEGATAQYYSAGDRADETLDFTASYYVRLVTLAGDTLYSCPVTPVRSSLQMATVYPNPVASGESLHIETGFAVNDDEHVQIRIVDLSGRMVQAGSFRGKTGTIQIERMSGGYYILQLSGTRETQSFGIFVK